RQPTRRSEERGKHAHLHCRLAKYRTRVSFGNQTSQWREPMIKKLLIGAVVASILQFVWSGISYKALTWHQGTMESFKDEAAMVKALNANAPKPGIYVLPNPSPQNAPTDPEQKKAWEEKCKAMWAAGPVVFA